MKEITPEERMMYLAYSKFVEIEAKSNDREIKEAAHYGGVVLGLQLGVDKINQIEAATNDMLKPAIANVKHNKKHGCPP